MPKSQFLDPRKVRKSGKITFNSIPVNQYKTPFEEEKGNYKKRELMNIYRDMAVIREFESMLNQIMIMWAASRVKPMSVNAGPAVMARTI